MTKKELTAEGITEELILSINIKLPINPVQLMPNEEPVNLVRCSKGFWISVNSELLKDKNNDLMVITEKEAKIGRARYLLNFGEKMNQDLYDKKIEKEILRLKEITDEKLIEILKKLKDILVLSGSIKVEGLEAAIYSMMESQDPNHYNYKVEMAKDFVDEETISLYERLLSQKNLGDKKDYDSLYVTLIQDGLPMVASFKMEKENDMKAMISAFHRDKIEETVLEIQSNNHLQNVAKFNVEKRNN